MSPVDQEPDNSGHQWWRGFPNEMPHDASEAGFIHFLLILLILLAIIALTIWIIQQLA